MENIEDKIRKIISGEINPLLLRDGGNVEFISFDKNTGVVKVRLQGACAHCPMSGITLKYSVEEILKQKASEVKSVESI